MVLFNYSTKELTAKVVYYGPGLCGKTTNLQFIHGNLPGNVKGKMLSLATKTDRTLFFDFLPIDLGEIRGMKTRVQLYTVPGQVFYNETRKLVLKGADGIVFVADSQEAMMGANAESFKNLDENLKAHGMNLAEMPHVIQFNKRDLPKLASIEALNGSINKFNAPFYESVATTGIGVQDTLKAITKLVLLNLTRRYDPKAAGEMEQAAAPKASAPIVTPPVAVPVVETTPEPEAIPVAVTPVAAKSVPEFDENEIDDLVDEVEEAPEPVLVQAVEAEIPVAAPPAEIPAVEVPVAEVPVAEVPVAEIPVAETPVAPVPMAAAPAEPSGPSFEVDHQIDPEWDGADAPLPVAAGMESMAMEGATVQISAMDPAPPPVSVDESLFGEALEPVVDAGFEVPADDAPGDEAEITLTEVAEDHELFQDPSLEVARLTAGLAREIVVPVEVGEGDGVRRFKLTVRLKLDPVG